MGDEAKLAAFARDLEELGPTYIKLGQLLSTRFDLLPPAYTAAARLERRRAVRVRRRHRDRRVRARRPDPPPLRGVRGGAAGRRLARPGHQATLPSGREVVVKVQRPEAREIAREDMETLARLAGLADRHTQAGRRYGFEQLLSQFRRSLAGELDYRREAATCSSSPT